MQIKTSRWLLWLVGLQLLVLFAPSIVWLWGRWTMSVWHHAHGLIIAIIITYIIRNKLREIRDLPTSDSAWGFLLLVPALLLHTLDAGMHAKVTHASVFPVNVYHPFPVDGLIRIQITRMQIAAVHFNDFTEIILIDHLPDLLHGRNKGEFR